METEVIEKAIIEIKDGVPTHSIEVIIESAGRSQEGDVFFHTNGLELPSKQKLWQREHEKRITVQTGLPVITVPHCHKKDKITCTAMHAMESFNKVPRRLIDRETDPVLINSKGKMLDLTLV